MSNNLEETTDRLLEGAISAEKSARYEQAGSLYASLGVLELSIGEYTSSASARKGLAHLLQAICINAVSGRRHRAMSHYEIFDRFAEKIGADTADPVVEGLMHEWRGDALLMIEDIAARREYDLAAETFAAVDRDTRMHWGARPEYDTAYDAARTYMSHHGITYFESHDWEFLERAEWKADVASTLLGDEE